MSSYLKLRTVWIVSLLVLSVIPALGAEKEQREPKQPVFSVDGTRLAYCEDVTKAGEVLPSSTEIWVINRDGTNARQLTRGAKDSHPRFSPDGQLIAFTRDRDIWTVKIDGSGLRNITETKEATESAVEFTRDGDLVYLREAYEQGDSTLTSNVLLKSPITVLGWSTRQQSVVLRLVKNDEERVILGDGYEVTQLAPNPSFGDAVFVLCKPLDHDGKPVAEKFTPDKVVAVVKLEGGAPRTVFAPKPENKVIIEQVRVTPQHNVLVIKTPDQFVGYPVLLEKDTFIPLPDAPIFSDVSSDGKTIAGTGIVEGQASLFGIVLYDIETTTTKQLVAPAK